MHFYRVVSFVAFSLTLGTLTLASPALSGADVIERTEGGGGNKTDAIKQVLLEVDSSVKVVLEEFQSITGQENAVLSKIESLIGEVVKAADNARDELRVVGASSIGISVNTTEIALVVENLIAGVVGIVNVVEEVEPLLGSVILSASGLDVALANLLTEVDGIVAGVLGVVEQLLNGLGITSGTLNGISLVLVAGLFIL